MAASIKKLIVGRVFIVLAATLLSFQIFSCDLMVVLKETTLYKDAVDKPSGKEIVKTMLQPGTVLLPSKAHSTGHVAVIFDNCLFVQHWAACEFQDSVTKNGRTEVICLVEDNKWKLGWVELNDNVLKGTYQDRAQWKSCAGGPPKQVMDPSCYLTAAKTLFDSGTLALQKKQELAELERTTKSNIDAQELSSPSEKILADATATITVIKIGDTIGFPIIELPNKTKSDGVNAYIVNSVLGGEYTLSNLKAKLEQENKNPQGISDIFYTVTLNTPTVLSINIEICWKGANSSTCPDDKFNFDLTTGYNITLDQIFMPSKMYEIQKLVCNDYRKRLVQAKNEVTSNKYAECKELKDDWYKKDELAGGSYEVQWQKQMNLGCGEVQISKAFSISKDGINFYYYAAGIGFPEYLKPFEPGSEYFYPWAVLKPFLMPTNPISTLIK
ncbi:MAG TPA: hypothetical protein PK747_05535 [Acidobacteriota bacterium]|nr:hypothetical protein [Acidobacteriota bacterium]HQO18732.1 hypothetical protein [Acidobacteriota bacterium]HQQ46857.1 hypothetical protein [Acidobacteriota bacterium]